MKHDNLIRTLSKIVGDDNIISVLDEQYPYILEFTTRNQKNALCILKPLSVQQISDIMRFCSENKIAVVVRSGGSGVCGGSISIDNCVIISMEKLNRILEINLIDQLVISEGGVNTQVLQNEVLKCGLNFPQNISSSSLSFIGGNIAVSSGSPKSLKYGPTKNNVLNLEVVLPNGEIIWTSKNVKKNASGYNLTQLFIGSEGTLGIITKVVLNLVPHRKDMLLLISFISVNQLFDFVKELFKSGFEASSLEFMDKNGLNLVTAYLGKNYSFNPETNGLLWIEFEFTSENEKNEKLEMLNALFLRFNNENVLVSTSENEKIELWEIRKKIGFASLNFGEFRDIDIVVMRSKIDLMYSEITHICCNYGLEYAIVSHIGDGNFHINIFRKPTMNDSIWGKTIKECTSELFKAAIKLGGDISGEHGIGTFNREIYAELTDYSKLKLMKNIKKTFDPFNILNPNNIFI